MNNTLELNLQFFGGRGASSSGGGGGGGNVKIKNELDVWSERHNQSREEAATQIISATRDMNDEFGVMDHVTSVTVADFDKASSDTIAFFSPSDNKVVVNRAYTDLNKLQAAYEKSVADKYHPPLGKKSPMEAVTAHELGHAIADKINDKRRATGSSNVDVNSEVVINAWRKMYPNKAHTYEELVGIPKARANISRYSSKNYHETIAEAVADVYCNGGKAKKFSKAIVIELKDTIKREL